MEGNVLNKIVVIVYKSKKTYELLKEWCEKIGLHSRFQHLLHIDKIANHEPFDMILADQGALAVEEVLMLKQMDKPLLLMPVTCLTEPMSDSEKPIQNSKLPGQNRSQFQINKDVEDKEINKIKNVFQDSIFIKNNKQYQRLKLYDVYMLKAEGHHSMVYSSSGAQIVPKSLTQLHAQLPEHLFARVHRSYIINLFHLTSIAEDTLTIADKLSVPLGRKYRRAIIKQIEQG